MTLNKCIWDPKLRGKNIKGTNLKSLIYSSLRWHEAIVLGYVGMTVQDLVNI